MSGIFTGKDALTAVGQKTGKWNWALVGADENELPLAGGGSGGIDEMQSCLLESSGSVLFGLLRTNFSAGLSKFIFVLASSANVSAGNTDFNPAPRGKISGGQAVGKRPIFEKVMRQFAHFTLTIEVHDPADFNIEDVIAKVAKVSQADSARITVPAYNEYLGEQYVKTQAGWLQEKQRDRDAEGLLATDLPVEMPDEVAEADEMEVAVEAVPTAAPKEETIELAMPDVAAEEKTEAAPDKQEEKAEVVEAKPETKTEEKPAEPSKSAEAKPEAKAEETQSGAATTEIEAKAAAAAADVPVSLDPAAVGFPFAKGQTVFVFSAAAKRWIGDGSIVEVLAEPGTHQGFALPAGAVKVQYSEGKRAKWIPPDEAVKLLKVAPTAPPVLVGTLLKETHNFITEWHQRHFQISRGLMKWWLTQDSFTKDEKPNTTLTLKGLELQVHETTFRIRTGSSKGVIYAFDAGTAQNCNKWLNGIKAHAKYCDEVDGVFRK